MLAALTDHVWQSTLIAVLAAGLALALRKHSARVRYWLWFAASAKFLIPFSLLVALGGEFAWRVAQTAQPSQWQVTARRVFEPARNDALFASSFADIRDGEERSRGDGAASASAAEEMRVVAERTNASDASPAGVPAMERSYEQAASSVAPDSAESARRPQPATSGAATASASTRFGWQAALAAVWACGVAVVLGAAWRRWTRLRALLRASRAASLVGIDTHGLEVRVTHAPIEPGVFGILRPVLVLPDGIVERLSRAQLDAIVRHERMHVERRDNLTALPQMLVQALFWFHPLVWWVGARLIAERERACDEAVLASGAEARAYAGGIVAVCEAYVASPLRCAAGVSGGPLERRVADILARRKSRALGSAGKYALLAMVAGLLMAPILAGALAPRAASAQEEPGAAGAQSGATLADDDEPRYLWAPLSGPPPLVVGYGRNGNEGYFNLSLRECAIRAAEDDGDPDIGVPPFIGDFKALVRYAYDLDTDELVWRNPVEVPGLQLVQYPLVRHSTCRTLLRGVLENSYSLERHEEDGRFVVDRIDVPAVPLSPWERGPQPPIDLEPAFLDRHVGYYYGYPEAFEREFAPVFRLRRDGTNLVLEWSGRSFELYAQNATRFSTHLRFESEPDNKPLVSLSFETDDTGQRFVFVDQSRNVPQMAARPIDAQSAEALLSLIDEKIEHRASSPFARALVDAIVARLDAAESAGVALADSAAQTLTERIERWRPGALVSRGKLASVLFREVLPSGREIYEATYENVAIRFDVVLALDGSVQGVFLDIACRMRHGATNEMAPCTAPFYVGEEPRVAVVPVLFSSLNLLSRGFVGGESGERSALLSLRRCDSPESGEASTPSSHRVSGFGEPLSDFVRNVYHLEREELVWRVETDPSITVSLPKDAFDVSSTRSVDVPLTYDCEAFARRGLSEELGLKGHFETRVLSAFELTRTARDLRGLEPPTTSEPWVGRESGMRLRGRNADMGTLAEYLGSQLGVRVFDRTNIPGNYDFTVVWDPGLGGGADRRERDRTALLEGLRNAGFDLVPIEIERDVLVVERLDAPLMPRPGVIDFRRF